MFTRKISTYKGLRKWKFSCCTTKCKYFFFQLNLLRWHRLIKLYRFQVYDSTTHHLYMVLCVHHPKSSLLPSPFVPLYCLIPPPPPNINISNDLTYLFIFSCEINDAMLENKNNFQNLSMILHEIKSKLRAASRTWLNSETRQHMSVCNDHAQSVPGLWKWVDVPWLVGLSGSDVVPQTERLLVRFPGRAQARVAGQVPHWGCLRSNQCFFCRRMLLSLFFSLPPPRSKNK